MTFTSWFIAVTVEVGDALVFPADVLALKYAQSLYGVDEAVVDRLTSHGQHIIRLLPKISGFRLIECHRAIGARFALFVGVKPLSQFGYQEIREFGRKVLTSLAGEAPSTEHVCLTIHGPGYGLDEAECFEAELAGLLDAIDSGKFPEALRRITIIDRNPARVKRLNDLLSRLLPTGRISLGQKRSLETLAEVPAARLRTVGYSSANKPNIFVAMPFSEDMDDVFHYGIQGAVNAAGYLCERADLSSFTGDVMDWVKKRIASASLVIADLSTANANVYLEVGYAWGCGKPTVLLVRNPSDLKFDVKGQRCLVYKKIKDLELSLRKELESFQKGQT
ncbi:MAG: hypothetical protein AB1473_14705 [Thermodesulfobacteriota bacterium]